jgi:hypothetical protein
LNSDQNCIKPLETTPLLYRILGKIGGVPALGPGTVIPKLPTGGPGLRATASSAAREINYSKVEGKDARWAGAACACPGRRLGVTGLLFQGQAGAFAKGQQRGRASDDGRVRRIQCVLRGMSSTLLATCSCRCAASCPQLPFAHLSKPPSGYHSFLKHPFSETSDRQLPRGCLPVQDRRQEEGRRGADRVAAGGVHHPQAQVSGAAHLCWGLAGPLRWRK